MTGYINENNILFATWSYDDKGRVVMNEQAGGVNHYDFTYNADGSTTVSNSNNASRTYQFEVVNGAIKIDQITGDRCDTCPNGGIKSYLYNADGYAISKTDWNGNTTTYTRDTQGRELSRTEAAGTPEERTVTTTWDTNLNKPLIVTEPERIIEYRYSPEGRLLSREERPRS
jgi:YD repeat-containing protein